jgi:hypothetical protein
MRAHDNADSVLDEADFEDQPLLVPAIPFAPERRERSRCVLSGCEEVLVAQSRSFSAGAVPVEIRFPLGELVGLDHHPNVFFESLLINLVNDPHAAAPGQSVSGE